MILQALKEYYDRKAAEPDSDIAPEGFENKEIPFVIALGTNGIPVVLSSTYEGTGKARRAKKFMVPKAVKKTSGISSNLLWENPEYALGIDLRGKPDRVKKQHAVFIERIKSLGVEDEGIEAVLKFLSIANKEEIMMKFDDWLELRNSGANLSFALAGKKGLILERPAVKKALEQICQNNENEEEVGICLISAESHPIERLHTAIKGVWGAQTSGANIVSFNLPAFGSFGKKQGANAPVGKIAAFAYTTALNHLLSKDSGQRMQVGDASTVFWAEKPTRLETDIVDIFGEPPRDDPNRGAKAVKNLFKSIETGAITSNKKQNRFYVLGLAPNASRIAIRFWIVDTVAGMSKKIMQHFEDLCIVHGPQDKDTLSLFRLLVSTAVQGKSENIPPNLSGDTMRAILGGLPYPQTLMQATILRVRAEQAAKCKKTGKPIPNVPYARAALLKAYINRQTRFNNPQIKEELKMSLDTSNINIGYRLGRLFATLEKIQIERYTQNGGKPPNSTIRDRFYGAASGTPVTVFSNLMRLKNHHLAKLESQGRRIYFEKLIGEIMDTFDDFPGHLPLAEQGRFAIGYYHQNRKFYTRKETKLDESQTTNTGEPNNE